MVLTFSVTEWKPNVRPFLLKLFGSILERCFQFSSLQDECGNFSSILDLESVNLDLDLCRSSGNAKFSPDLEVVKQPHMLLEQQFLLSFLRK